MATASTPVVTTPAPRSAIGRDRSEAATSAVAVARVTEPATVIVSPRIPTGITAVSCKETAP